MKTIEYIGHMTEAEVPFNGATFTFKPGVPREVPEGLAADLLKQPDKYKAAKAKEKE